MHLNALRAARSAPQMSLGSAAAAATVSEQTLRRRLRATPTRGACDALAVEMLADGRKHTRQAVLASALCPAPALRAAAASAAEELPHRPKGPATWTTMARSGARTRSQQAAGIVLAEHRGAIPQPAGSLPRSMLWRLARSEYPAARQWVPYQQRTSPGAVSALAADTDSEVRRSVAGSPRITATARRLLAADPQARVRCAVALSERTPPDALARLATDPAPAVRRLVAVNETAAAELLERLTKDSDAQTTAAAALHPACPRPAAEAALTGATAAREYLARSEYVPEWMQQRLAGDSDWAVRAALAANRRCDPKIRRRLAEDPDSTVRDHAGRRGA